MWCTQCRQEYRPGFTRCSDCDLDLVDEQPDPAPADKTPTDAAPTDEGHDLVEYDLAELTDEQVKTLELLLSGAHLAYGWEPTRRLVVAASTADSVDDILDFVDASFEVAPVPPSGARPPGPRRSRCLERAARAGPARDAAGAVRRSTARS